MARSALSLPALGVDLLSEETGLAERTVRRAENVDIHRNGVIRRRGGYAIHAAGDGFQALFASPHGLLAQRWGNVYRLDTEALLPVKLCETGALDAVDFTTHNGHTYFGNAASLWWIPGNEAVPRPVGVPLPAALPGIEAHAAGTLPAGRYVVAVSRLDDRGEESSTKVLGQVDMPTGGGIRLYGMTPDLDAMLRVYLTPPDGEALYLAESFSAAFSEYVVTRQPDGAIRSTQHLAPLPGCDFIRGHAGRLYVARDDTVFFSEPLRPHLHDPRHNFIKFSGPIRFLEPVAGGLYVGDERGVWFLDGNQPEQIRPVSSVRAVRRSSLRISGAHFNREVTQSDQDCAVWLSEEGYMLGRAAGDVVSLHPERVRVEPGLEGRSRLVVRNGIKQVVTLVSASQTAAYGVALDTSMQ